MDYVIFSSKRDSLLVGNTHYIVPVAKVVGCVLKLQNAQFILSRGLGETTHCVVSVTKMIGWLLELHSVQLERAWTMHCATPKTNIVA